MNNDFSIEVSNRQSRLPVDEKGLCVACDSVLAETEFEAAEISLVVVCDQEMHQLNDEHLAHDYPTDVLSFPLERSETFLAGEIIVSADTANSECQSHGLSYDQELLLYVIHGLLHLVGYDDKSDETRVIMRQKEKYFMEKNGVNL